MKILLADDSITMRGIILRSLQAAGCGDNIVEAVDADDAFTKFKPHEFDLAVIDSNMPGISSLDLIKEIRQQDEKVKIFLIIVYSEEGRVMSVIEQGADDYLVKPFTVDALREKVNKHFPA
jgi:two-component system, chemotaxis family, chemotaxis protein CheY